MKHSKHVGHAVYRMIYMLILGIPGLAACSNQDTDEDGKSDIIITGTFQLPDGTETTGMWICRQTQNGGDELWEDAGRMNLMHKIAYRGYCGAVARTLDIQY
ncbi:MAG: hypothetical protein J6K48_00770 [Lachnospiraceae bacterium]|nr:hypothetical protein [Lachnospiraceae bacterium]